MPKGIPAKVGELGSGQGLFPGTHSPALRLLQETSPQAESKEYWSSLWHIKEMQTEYCQQLLHFAKVTQLVSGRPVPIRC